MADSDLLLWVKGIANGYRLDVLVDEPDVSPLAVQGPKADALMARVFGEASAMSASSASAFRPFRGAIW
jgi:dimethylsulfoniopropionate demethylase